MDIEIANELNKQWYERPGHKAIYDDLWENYQVRIRLVGEFDKWENLPDHIIKANSPGCAAEIFIRENPQYEYTEVRVNRCAGSQGYYFGVNDLEPID